MTKVFIDGSAGTAGLRIYERLAARRDLELIKLPEDKRRDKSARGDAINSADVAFLCLPDEASRESVSMVESESVAVIDTSTAFRTAPGWDYGFPELYGRRERIKKSKRVGNPGCHASGFIVLIEPLVRAGIIPRELALTCFSLTGYSGGGKAMIAEYEAERENEYLFAPRIYALPQQHKHLPEMAKIAGLEVTPIFCPIVADYYSGMETSVPVFAKDLNGTVEDIKAVYADYYKGPVVRFNPEAGEGGMLAANRFSGRDDMEVTVTGNGERILLTSRFDNLGKGASGAAVQNMNLIIGAAETEGLVIGE